MWNWLRRSRTWTARRPRPTVWIPASVLDRTANVLRQSGSGNRSHEGVAYWAGRRRGDDCFVLTCIAPAAKTTFGSFDTTSETNARVVMYLAKTGVELVGQVHSHPGTVVDHSDGDNERALMPYEGFLSVVVPQYARRGMRPLTICGIHVFDNSRFRRLGDDEINARFRIVEDFADLRA